MQSPISRHIISGALVSVALTLAAGGAVSAQSSPAATKMFLSNGQVVQVFQINNSNPGSPVATLQTSEAEGLAVDRDGRLLVARGGHSDVLLFDTHTLRQVGVLKDPGQQPNSIFVSRDGTVYVGNVFKTNGKPGSVSVYEHGSRTPTKMLSCSDLYMVTGVAVNSHGDVFVNQNKTSSGTGVVDVFPAGSKKCQELGIGEYYAGGAWIDPGTQDLFVADHGGQAINVLAPPYKSVQQSIHLPRCIGEEVWAVTLDPATSLLYISDPNNGADVLYYPGGSRMATYYTSSAVGIAISR